MADGYGFAQGWTEFRPSKTLWFWSCVACIVATIIVGFAAAGWVTGGSAAQMAKDAADSARTKLAAAVCVNRFKTAPNAATQLAALKKTESWEQGDFIQKGGWLAIPGYKQSLSDAADLCAQHLVTASAETTAAK